MDFIYCREYGKQPAIPNITWGFSKAFYRQRVIINQSVKKTATVIDKVNNIEVVDFNRILYDKCIELFDLGDFTQDTIIKSTIYVGKRTDLYIENVPFDFVADKWRFRNLKDSNLNNTKFNVYDRPKIRSILSQFLTRNVDEVFEFMYKTIATPGGMIKFITILETVAEYKDEFLEILKPYEATYNDPYANDYKQINSNPIINGSGNAGKENTSNNTMYYVGGGLLLLWIWKKRRKKRQ